MRVCILLSITQILFLLFALVSTIPIEDEKLSMNYLSNLDGVSNTKEGDGLSPEIFQLLLKSIDTIINRTFPETYGKISVEDRTEIPRSVVRHFSAISIEQLDEIEVMVDELIKDYKKMHSMAVTFYQRPKDGMVQKKRFNSQEDDYVVGMDKEEKVPLLLL